MTNVALIVLDAVRKDFFDKYATRLKARASVDIDYCYAPSSWSIPSHSSIFTGRLPYEHGVHSYNPDYASLPSTFFGELTHHSVCVSGNGVVSDSFNVDVLFDDTVAFTGNIEYTPRALTLRDYTTEYDGIERYRRYLQDAYEEDCLVASILNGLYIKFNWWARDKPFAKIGDYGATTIIKESVARTADREPFFLFTNFVDAHGPMQNIRPFDSSIPRGWDSNDMPDLAIRNGDFDDEQCFERYRELYAESIKYLDKKVSSFVNELQSRTEEDTVVIVTADHGEELRLENERDLGHADFSDPLLQVPFLVIGTEEVDVDGTVSLLDVGRIVRSVAGENDGIEVPTRERVPCERPGMMFYDGDDPYWTRSVRGVYEGATRYEWDSLGTERAVETGISQDLSSEPIDIPARIRELFTVPLEKYADGERTDEVDVSEGTERHLEDLGYKL